MNELKEPRSWAASVAIFAGGAIVMSAGAVAFKAALDWSLTYTVAALGILAAAIFAASSIRRIRVKDTGGAILFGAIALGFGFVTADAIAKGAKRDAPPPPPTEQQ